MITETGLSATSVEGMRCVWPEMEASSVCEELQACSDYDDYDLCDGDGDCCAIEFSEVDLSAIENSDDPCGQYTSSVTLCAPPEITFLDDVAELAQFVFEDSEGHKRMLLLKHGIAGFEDTDLQPCRGAPEDYEDICASCEFMLFSVLWVRSPDRSPQRRHQQA